MIDKTSTDSRGRLSNQLQEMIARDPDLRDEITRMYAGVSKALEGVEVRTQDVSNVQLSIETIVKKTGRPVLTILHDTFTFDSNEIDSQVWQKRLEQARANLRKAILAVGRVDLEFDPEYEWVGTAWLIRDDIAVTNRHVAEVFAKQSGDKFVFRTAAGFRQPREASIDFLAEEGNSATRTFAVKDVLYIESDDNDAADLAFLQLEPQSGDARLASPIRLGDRAASSNQFIAAIGYPARDSRIPDQSLVTQIFGNIYDKKRLAPGAVLTCDADILTHDCSTLGGNSGSALIDLSSGTAVGLHRAGRYLEANFAVPAAVLDDRLRKLSPRPKPDRKGPSTVQTAGSSKPTETQGAGTGTVPPSVPQTPSSSGQPLRVSAQGATWMIPLTVTVNVGMPQMSQGDPGGIVAGPSGVDRAVAELRQLLGPRKDIADIRAGYRFKDNWISDERAVVVAVLDKAATGIPPSVLGVPVQVTPATPWDLIPAVPAVEALERVPATHYEPPTDVQLEEVNEQMKVVCHVSPDAGWPTLDSFLHQTDDEPTRLTIGIYNFGARHIIDAVKVEVQDAPHTMSMVIQHGGSLEGDAKKDDVTDEEAVEVFDQALTSRFDQAWASVKGPNRLFASAYHIKVIVRSGKAIWLSSGNLQSSNQPNIDPIAQGDETWEPLQDFNREWHAIIENTTVAQQFEKFLLWDLKEAKQAAEEAIEAPEPMIVVPQDLLAAEAISPEVRRGKPTYFKPLTVNRQVRVQPLLTPDNYQPKVLEFVRSAQQSLYFQNQSLNLAKDNEDRFLALVDALLKKQQSGLDVRIIIRGDFNPRPVLERLKEHGFNMNNVRVQNKCHTKGIVVDSKSVLLGSHNWTNQGTLVNRDASLIFYDEEIAKYYENIFEFDWDHLASNRLNLELPPVRMASTNEAPTGGFAMRLQDALG
jgi:hypothetical protein